MLAHNERKKKERTNEKREGKRRQIIKVNAKSNKIEIEKLLSSSVYFSFFFFQEYFLFHVVYNNIISFTNDD